MQTGKFIVVGENIHCTRIVLRNGKRTRTLPSGVEVVDFDYKGVDRQLPIPSDWGQISPAFNDGKVKHAALAIHQSRYGSEDEKQAGCDYLCWMADRQIEAGATFLDINVDEYSNDVEVVQDVMRYVVGFYSERYDIPLSIDSSNPDTLRIGLEQCRKDICPPMINSVSLERVEAVELMKEFNSDTIVNAAGREGLPSDVAGRIENFKEIIGLIDDAGIPRDKLHLDPLVLPVSTDPMNGATFLEANREALKEFEGVHLNGGLSNISFGMPNRKLLNMVFLWLCMDSGTDGGIIDPVSMPVNAVAEMDTKAEPFKLARAFLTGEDMFGMEYITAHREGRLK